jgi:hypothetical protein
MNMTRVLGSLRARWKLAAILGLILMLVSLALLAYVLSPAGEAVRVQATLAPTLFVPPGGVP